MIFCLISSGSLNIVSSKKGPFNFANSLTPNKELRRTGLIFCVIYTISINPLSIKYTPSSEKELSLV